MDKKAKQILFKTYWTSQGWKSNHSVNQDDFKYAKSKGLMFDPISIQKEELTIKLQEIIKEIEFNKITDAFLSSLTNKRLDWRSGIASYFNAKRILSQDNIQDYYYGFGNNIDVNVLNFERIKWGGVRHNIGLYNLIDLQLLQKETITSPTKEDLYCFTNILNLISNSLIKDTPVKLRDNLKSVFNVSKDHRHTLIEILSCIEILQPLSDQRKEPGKHDWTFALFWRGEDKYDKQKVIEYFGKYGMK